MAMNVMQLSAYASLLEATSKEEFLGRLSAMPKEYLGDSLKISWVWALKNTIPSRYFLVRHDVLMDLINESMSAEDVS